jgi:hypothetical protein
MSDLVERCQRRADKENDDHITTAEWKSLISEVYAHDVHSVVSETGLRYFEYTASLVSTGATYLAEPEDHFATIRLDYVDSAGKHFPLAELNSHEEAYFAALGSGTARFYALVDDRIYVYPTPASGQTYSLLYIPQPPDLSEYADDDVVDVVTADGEACLIWGVAALAKAKASQDASLHLKKQEEHRYKLQGWAAERALAHARRRPAADEYAERGFEEGDYR